MISVNQLVEEMYEVRVDSGGETIHLVTLDNQYYNELSGPSVSREDLIIQSFEFLLERESNTMILPKFDLRVIQTYFPDFEDRIKKLNLE